MSRFHLTAGLAIVLIALGATAAASQTLCKPAVSSKSARSFAGLNQQRRWTAVFAVDASRCATTSGTFDVDFVREKEVGPDLEFTQRLVWSPGRTEIAMDMWWDEWIADYQVGGVTACPCRE